MYRTIVLIQPLSVNDQKALVFGHFKNWLAKSTQTCIV